VARPVGTPLLALLVVLAAWWSKEAYWRFIDTNSAPSTVASATALGSRGRVRMLEPPHTQDNYLLQEMGFSIARKHKTRLRLIARTAAFVLPALLSLVALIGTGMTAAVAAALAVTERGAGAGHRALAVLRRGEAYRDALLRLPMPSEPLPDRASPTRTPLTNDTRAVGPASRALSLLRRARRSSASICC